VDKTERRAPGNVEPEFAAPAYFKKTNGDSGTDKSEAGDHRKDEMQQILADQKQCQKQGEQRINYAQEEDMAWFGIEVVKALLQRLPEIFYVNPADSDLARCNVDISKSFFLGHSEPSFLTSLCGHDIGNQ
jgi:hypothetical protein